MLLANVSSISFSINPLLLTVMLSISPRGFWIEQKWKFILNRKCVIAMFPNNLTNNKKLVGLNTNVECCNTEMLVDIRIFPSTISTKDNLQETENQRYN
jgi:hypothetical protein